MNSKMKKLLVNAAMAGMIAGVGTMGAPSASAATNPSESVRNGCGGKDGCGGKSGDKAENADKNACKGLNSSYASFLKLKYVFVSYKHHTSH